MTAPRKPPGTTRRRQLGPSARVLPAEGRKGKAPPLPRKRPAWLAETRQWWARIWRSPSRRCGRRLTTTSPCGSRGSARSSRAEAQLLERAFAGAAYVDHDLVFADELGGPHHPQRLTEWFGKLRKAAGIPAGTLHVLRHTAATPALTEGVPINIVAARLGDDPNTVLDT